MSFRTRDLPPRSDNDEGTSRAWLPIEVRTTRKPFDALRLVKRRSPEIVAVALLALVIAVGVAHSHKQSQELVSAVQRSAYQAAQAAERLLAPARSEVQLIASRMRAGLPLEGIEITSAGSIALYEDAPGMPGHLVLRQRLSGPRAHAEPDAPTIQPLHEVMAAGVWTAVVRSEGGNNLVLTCARALDRDLACASITIARLLDQASSIYVHGLEVSVSTPDGNPIGSTALFEEASTKWGRSRFALRDAPLTFRARPTNSFVGSYMVNLGYVFAAAGGLLVLMSYACFRFYERTRSAQRKMALAISQGKEARLEGLRTALRNIAGASGVRFSLLDRDGQMELFGPWLDAAGIEGSRISLVDFVADTDRPEELLLSVQAALEKRQPWSGIYARNVDGTRSTHQTSATPVFLDGDYQGLATYSADITMAVDVAAANRDASANEAALETYVRHLGHELRAAVLRATSTLPLIISAKAGEDEERVHHWKAVAESSLAHATAVVNAAIKLMSLRQSKARRNLSPAQLSPLVERPAAAAKSVAGAHAQTVVLTANAHGDYMVHQESLAELLVIVITNAIRYSPPGSKIYISTEDGADEGCIIVEDEGPGLTEAELKRIGEPFFHGAATLVNDVKGHGHGLAMALELARQCRATITFSRSAVEGRGLRVTICVPAAPKTKRRTHQVNA